MLTSDCFDAEGQLRLTPEETVVMSLIGLFDGEIERVAYAACREIDYIVEIVSRIGGKGIMCNVVAPHQEPWDKMKEFQDKIKKRQKGEINRKLGPNPAPKTIQKLYNRFCREWQDEFEDTYPKSKKKDLAMLKRTLKWAGGDLDLLEDMLGTFVSDWAVIRGLFKVKGSRPMLHLFCSGWFFERLRCYTTGEVINPKDRFSEDDSPTVGW